MLSLPAVLSVLVLASASVHGASGRLRTAPAAHIAHVKALMESTTAPTCPCSDQSLCRPTYQPKSDDANKTVRAKEVFGFVGDGGLSHAHYDWSVVSTVAWADDDGAMCEAHKNGARVIMSAPGFKNQGATPFPQNATARLTYINNAIKATQQGHFDGVTFDYESAITAAQTGAMDLYIQLIKETTAAFHTQVPGSQISVCVAWSPDDIDGRAYDYKKLADASDLLYIMVYDTRSQIYDQCLASGNSPVPVAHRAVQRYSDIGVDPAKLILGIPWYSYDYPCNSEMESPTSKYCPIDLVPFRGINCSDAAGGERPYGKIMSYLNSPNGSLTGRMWDTSMQNPYFNYKDEKGVVHQIWYDDPESLNAKYRIAKAAGLRGTGPFTFDMLDYKTDIGKTQAAAMWAALHTFTD